MQNLEKNAKKKINCLNSKVQNFDFEQWKQQTINQLKSWLNKVENLTEDMLNDNTRIEDLFKQMEDDDSLSYDSD